MAKKKPCPEGAAESSRKQQRWKLTAAECSRLIPGLVPAARSGYALFYSSSTEDVKQRLKDIDSACPQREVMKQISADWRNLSEESREKKKKKSVLEHRARKDAVDRLYSEFSDSVQPAAAEDPGLLTLGDFVLTNEILWSGYSVKCFRCYHKTLHYNAMALKFQNLCDFRHEVKIMNKIAEHPGNVSQELFLQVMQTVPLAERPANCLIVENLPLLETWVREESPLTGDHLKALAVQLASGLQFLHSLGFWHADIRPKTIFWSHCQSLAKIGRYALARPSENQESEQPAPYTGPYRAPELWRQGSTTRVTGATESFAFGVTLVEASTAEIMFPNAIDVVNYSEHEQHPVLQALNETVRFVLLHFLRREPDVRMLLPEFLSPNSASLRDKLAVQ
ncbi:MPK12 [Symbiodinium sp. CCMP2592]|nr:MPK12 [Symbiodinium sp. CCMP2592]